MILEALLTGRNPIAKRFLKTGIMNKVAIEDK